MIESKRELYPQYRFTSDRRQMNMPVDVERRSGMDRRFQDRIVIDQKLDRDIFEIKSKAVQIQHTEPIKFRQNAAKALQNNIKTDEFIKTEKPENKASKDDFSDKTPSASAAGAFAFILGGVLISTMFGVSGIAIALGLGAYFGLRLFAEAMHSHMKNKD
ncbi:MAG TPA: hypothetical protein PKI94_04590 [Candidatus Gastranaerophilaceae bacterium]|nr:hypothetical protein [Candidatus Gastranaerophilaceae bacterium]